MASDMDFFFFDYKTLEPTMQMPRSIHNLLNALILLTLSMFFHMIAVIMIFMPLTMMFLTMMT
jgi:hypothetical protein